MSKNPPKSKAKTTVSKKVIVGFVLALFLVISVSVITYYSIRNLLDTVQDLSEPNEKLRQMNGLLADVYLLDMSKTERTSDRDSVLEETLGNIKERLDWLISNSTDSTDIRSFEEIQVSVSELLVVYAGLEEVRYNLTSRTFSEEALRGIETRIKRQEELSDMQFLGRIKSRDLLTELGIARDGKTQLGDSLIIGREDRQIEDEIEEIVRDMELQAAQTDATIEESGSTNVALEALKKLMTQMFKDEQRLQQDFTSLENRLLNKNKEVFSQIQGLISNMQRDLLIEYRDQNQSAYNLTQTVSVILGLMVFLGIIGSLGFVYNILSEIKKANTYQERLEEAKAESDKLAKAKQDFLANMSHEIRNPIHAIQGYQNALDKSSLDGTQKEYVQMIGFASGTLVGIVNDILDFSKLEAGKIQVDQEPFDPKRLIHAIKSFFTFKFEEKGLGFNWDIQLPNDKWLKGDALRINQILNNLLTNALKFTEKGEIEVKVIFKDKRLLLSVEDTGMGMSEKVRANIFEEFNQGDTSVTRKYGGTGLGLSIVKKLVDLQNGTIQVESTQGVGTKFEIQLPAEVTPIPDIVENNTTAEISLHGLRVLVVDDDAIGLKLIRLLLEGLGAEVDTYRGGKDFKDNFLEKHFDLALLDIQMPEVSGWQVLKILKNIPQFENLKVIAMTANVFADEQNQIINAGFNNLILKPFNEDKLTEAIASTINVGAIQNTEMTDLNELKSDKPLYDLNDLGKFCMGDEEMLVEVLGDIVHVTSENLNHLKLAISQSDYNRIREITHQLSSRLGQIKSPLSEKARNIEVALKANEKDNVLEDTDRLIPQVKELLILIQEEHDLGLKEEG